MVVLLTLVMVVNIEEVKEALRDMKNGRATGPSGITAGLLKAAERKEWWNCQVLNDALKSETPEN